MAFLDKIFTLGRSKDLIDIDETQIGYFGALEGYRANDLVSNRNDHELAKFYRSWVKVAIDKIAEKIAMVEYEVKSRKDDTIIDNHPLTKLLQKPNKIMSKSKFVRRVVSNNLLYGKSPLQIIGAGRPKELIPISPIGFKAKWNKAVTEVLYFYYSSKPNSRKFEVEEIIPIFEFHPTDPMDGISPTRSNLYGIETLIEMENWVYMFFASGGIPPFSIIYDQKLTADQIEKIKERFKQEYAGSNNAFQPMVMSGGAKVEKTGLSPKDIELSDTEKTVRDKVLAQYSVPKAVVGLVDDVNRASYEGSLITFLENTVLPKVISFVDDLNAFLTPMFGEDIYIDFKPFIPSDKKAEAETKTLRGKWVTINELRAEEGLDPIEDGDRLLGDPVININTERRFRNLESKIDRLKFFNGTTKNKDMDSTIKWLNNKALKTEGILASSLQKYMEGLEQRLITNLKNTKSFSVKKGIESIFDDKTEVGYIYDILKVFYDLAGREAVDEALSLLDIEDYDPIIDLAQAYETMLSKSSAQIGNTIKQWIIEDLLIGLGAGEGIEDLTDRIKNISSYINDHHAFTIAQTETTKVTNYTYFETYKKSGAPYKGWVNLGDGRVRESHQDVKPTRVDSKFDVGGSKMDYPGDPNGNAEDVIQCRCRVLPLWSIDNN